MDTTHLNEFISPEIFRDCLLQGDSRLEGIDVVMPIQNTNPFFERNLVSIFRELPVSRLIVGDGGCTDESLRVLSKFPRVTVIDHNGLSTLGGSLRELINAVETEKFAYLHSDVFLPRGFFKELMKNDFSNSWLESNRNSLVVHEDINDHYFKSERPYSGAQFGESTLLKRAVAQVEDDFLYRNEDLVIRELVIEAGGHYKKVSNLKHLHQSVTKNLENEPALKVTITRSPDFSWEEKTTIMQYRGLIKYTNPIRGKELSYLVDHVNSSLRTLNSIGALDWKEVVEWVTTTNPSWLPFLKRPNRASKFLDSLTRRLKALVILRG
jgi:hypothetical protein